MAAGGGKAGVHGNAVHLTPAEGSGARRREERRCDETIRRFIYFEIFSHKVTLVLTGHDYVP